jgi:hypothetical protein
MEGYTWHSALLRTRVVIITDNVLQPLWDCDPTRPGFIVERARLAYADRLRALYAHGADLIEHPTAAIGRSNHAYWRGRRSPPVEPPAHGDGFAAHFASTLECSPAWRSRSRGGRARC